MIEDTMLTLEDIGEVFYDLTSEILNNSPPPDVRLSWPTEGAPAFTATEDVIFLKVYDVDGVYTKQRENIYEQIGSPEEPNMCIGFTRQLEINWIFYGPNSWSNAAKIRNQIFYQRHHDTLALRNLYMLPNFAPPKRMPELFQGLWYERMDLTIQFYELVIINDMVPSIESVEIGLFNETEKVMDFEIENND